MPTRAQVRRLLEQGCDHEAAGAVLGIPPGQAYMIATGMPADGGEAPLPGREPPGWLPSPQHLANPPAVNPTAKPAVHDWMRRRAEASRTAS